MFPSLFNPLHQIHHDGHRRVLHAGPARRRHHLQLAPAVPLGRRNGRHRQCAPVRPNSGPAQEVLRVQLLRRLHQVQLHRRPVHWGDLSLRADDAGQTYRHSAPGPDDVREWVAAPDLDPICVTLQHQTDWRILRLHRGKFQFE